MQLMTDIDDGPTTSKALILARINSEKGYAHFTRWKEFEKGKAIADCGLAKHKYSNKSKRDDILSHLFSVDLPLCDVKVKQMLDQRQILRPKGASSQQLTYILLTHLAPGLTPAPDPVPIQAIIPAPRQLVANQANIVCWLRISDASYVPYIYGDPEKEHLWGPRRMVTSCETHIICHNFMCNPSTQQPSTGLDFGGRDHRK